MNDHHREFGYTTPAAQEAAKAMYHETIGGQLAEPRAGVRIDGCSACRTRDHRDHYGVPTKRPLLMCATCKTFTRHEQTSLVDAELWVCGCGTAKRWGTRAKNGAA